MGRRTVRYCDMTQARRDYLNAWHRAYHRRRWDTEPDWREHRRAQMRAASARHRRRQQAAAAHVPAGSARTRVGMPRG